MSVPAIEWPEAEQRIAEVAATRRGNRDRALASSLRRALLPGV